MTSRHRHGDEEENCARGAALQDMARGTMGWHGLPGH